MEANHSLWVSTSSRDSPCPVAHLACNSQSPASQNKFGWCKPGHVGEEPTLHQKGCIFLQNIFVAV